MKKIILLVCLVLVLLTTPAFAAINERDYDVIPGRQFFVLYSEILTDDGNTIARSYKCYRGTVGTLDAYGSLYYGNVVDVYEQIPLDGKYRTLREAKKSVAQVKPVDLRLKPLTIVTDQVFNQWIKEGYLQENEYWEGSPKGLVYGEIKPAYEIIRAPFFPDGVFPPVDQPEIATYVNNIELDLGKDMPYRSESGELLIPLRPVSEALGYTVDYRIAEKGQPLIILSKGGKYIELSVWKDYFILNGERLQFATRPRLSINQRVMVPLSFINFLTNTVEWNEKNSSITISD